MVIETHYLIKISCPEILRLLLRVTQQPFGFRAGFLVNQNLSLVQQKFVLMCPFYLIARMVLLNSKIDEVSMLKKKNIVIFVCFLLFFMGSTSFAGYIELGEEQTEHGRMFCSSNISLDDSGNIRFDLKRTYPRQDPSLGETDRRKIIIFKPEFEDYLKNIGEDSTLLPIELIHRLAGCPAYSPWERLFHLEGYVSYRRDWNTRKVEVSVRCARSGVPGYILSLDLKFLGDSGELEGWSYRERLRKRDNNKFKEYEEYIYYQTTRCSYPE